MCNVIVITNCPCVAAVHSLIAAVSLEADNVLVRNSGLVVSICFNSCVIYTKIVV